MSLQTVSTSAFRSAVRQKDVVLVSFSTKWCPPCKVLRPILEELGNEKGSRLSVLQVDCDASPELAARYGIMSTPTVIVFHQGEPVNKLVGLRPKKAYEAALARYA